MLAQRGLLCSVENPNPRDTLTPQTLKSESVHPIVSKVQPYSYQWAGNRYTVAEGSSEKTTVEKPLDDMDENLMNLDQERDLLDLLLIQKLDVKVMTAKTK
ncbi:hypothetical protein Tco_0230990 [Tanacetum coccineum]|uniref:Uncharacterized protein n=1 Tax=Tanacetum coccineum TaxID=301880 RepID=A0ABQ5JDA5_9ASTR